MAKYPENISNTEQLDDILSTPTPEVIKLFSRLDGDIMFLGISGKIGPSLARMTIRACKEAGVKKQITGVALFDSEEQRKGIENLGIEAIHGDLLNTDFIKSLPTPKNVIFLAGMKFGSEDNLSLTWAINTYLPALIAEHFQKSRIVAFSTGCIYQLVPLQSGGSLETDKPVSVGEYAQSCLGRERMFEYGSIKNKTPMSLIRLNYSVEMRYGVLVDIAVKVKNNTPIDLSMGYFNVIWQGDVNAMVLQALEHCESPAKIINVTGPETASVRQVAQQFGEYFNIKPKFEKKETETALLSNASLSYKLFGRPQVELEQIILWIADWIKNEKELLGKPTHYEVRDGKY